MALAFIINSTAAILSGGFADTWVYLAGMFEAFFINYIEGLIIPVDCIGRAAAGGIGLKEGGLPHKLVRIFIVNAIFVTITRFCIALINCGPVRAVVSVWWRTYPILHLTGFIASILLEEPCSRLSQTIVDK